MENTETTVEQASQIMPEMGNPQPQLEAELVIEPALPHDDTDEFLTKIIEAAEHRGYVKARNELARAAMAKPRLWENPLRSESAAPVKKQDDTSFLTRLTPNVWD